MNGYGEIIKEIEKFLIKDGIVKTITHADIFERDINELNKYPLVNIIPIGFVMDENVTTFNIEVECLMQRDLRKDINRDEYKLNNNLVDNLNTTYAVLRRLFEFLKRDEIISVEMLGSGTPIIYENKNTLDGWNFSFNIEYPETDVNVC